jgi:UDPglucose 6-dehydrogenase
MKNIGFVGLGKLGLPVALSIENKGHKVCGYDINPDIAQYLDTKVIPYQEKGTPELLKKTKLKLCKSVYDVVEQSEIIFCPVQTPHNPAYEGILPLPQVRVDFDYQYLVNAVRDISKAAKDLKKEIILVIISTVLPGTIEREIKPILNKYIKLVYNPFFIAMGTTRDDFENPEFVLMGCDDREAADEVEQFYSTIHDKRVYRTNVANAEAIKVFYNTFISTKIAFANTIGMLAEKMNLNSDEIVGALFLADQRIISTKYMRAGMGDGGGCHPRDNIALSYVSRRENLPFDWFESIMMQREKHTQWLADIIEEYARKLDTSQVVLCGVAFKKETNLKIGSPALLLKYFLEQKGMKVYEWDPIVYPDQARVSLKSLNKKLFFISCNHDIFREQKFNNHSIVIDPWGIIPDQKTATVIRIGRH